jgi:hypothetical protein
MSGKVRHRGTKSNDAPPFPVLLLNDGTDLPAQWYQPLMTKDMAETILVAGIKFERLPSSSD